MMRESFVNHVLIGLVLGQCAFAAIHLEDPNTVPSDILQREIMESQIQPLYLSITSVTQTDLDALIDNLSRLEIPASKKKGGQESAVPAEVDGPAFEESAETRTSKTVANEQNRSDQDKAVLPGRNVPDLEWLAMIDHIEKAVDPLALGDVLFNIGQYERAERFYRQVLEQTTSPEDGDWQWATYQLANCLRRTNPQEAQKVYHELITQAPGSSWTAAAKAQQTTLLWYETMEASNLKRFLSDPNSL